MKKLSLLIIGAIVAISTAQASDFFENPFSGIKSGIYECNYEYKTSDGKPVNKTCTAKIEKDSSGYYLSMCPDKEKTRALIDKGKCKYTEIKRTTYTCQYKEGSCQVSIEEKGNSKNMSCFGQVPENSVIYEDIKNGKCYKEE